MKKERLISKYCRELRVESPEIYNKLLVSMGVKNTDLQNPILIFEMEPGCDNETILGMVRSNFTISPSNNFSAKTCEHVFVRPFSVIYGLISEGHLTEKEIITYILKDSMRAVLIHELVHYIQINMGLFNTSITVPDEMEKDERDKYVTELSKSIMERECEILCSEFTSKFLAKEYSDKKINLLEAEREMLRAKIFKKEITFLEYEKCFESIRLDMIQYVEDLKKEGK